MGQAHLLRENPQAQAEEGHGPSSKIRSTKGLGAMAEDSLVLGRSKVSLMKVAYEQTLEIKNISRKLSLIPFTDMTLHLTEPDS